jgi:hypothetical protein
MSAFFLGKDSNETSNEGDGAVYRSASLKFNGEKVVWHPGTSLLETTKFASLFCLMNEFEFNDSKPAAVIISHAKACSERCDLEKKRCFEAIQFTCKQQRCPEFLQTCCTILDIFTDMKSKSLVEYLRHNQWQKLSSIQPLDVFQETMVFDLIDSFDLLIQNRQIVLQDWASRLLCRFFVYFYKCMLFYMYLLKEQDKELRAKQLKLILNQRRNGLKASQETSIAPLFDTIFAISGKSDFIRGGQEFMVCIKADECTRFDEDRERNLKSYAFCAWSRALSFNRLSISSIVHSLMKLLQKCCRKWASFVSKSKILTRIWKRIFNILAVCTQQNRICHGHRNKMQQHTLAAVFQKWRQLNMASRTSAKLLLNTCAAVFLRWSQITKMQMGLASKKKMVIFRIFKIWKTFLASKLSIANIVSVWSAELSSKNALYSMKATFDGWKTWFLARWIVRSNILSINKNRATRALNAWMEYQILFIQKMIKCATHVKFLRDTNCIAAHFLRWKFRFTCKQNVKLIVIIHKMRISLRVWNHKCGFGVFKTGPNMTSSLFCLNRWKKVAVSLRVKRQVFLAWKNLSLRSGQLKGIIESKEHVLIEKCFSHLKLQCKRKREFRGAEFSLRQLAKKVTRTAKTRPNPEASTSKSLVDDAQTISVLNRCFDQWRAAVKDDQESLFMEMMFRCGELNSMRRHFNRWNQSHL